MKKLPIPAKTRDKARILGHETFAAISAVEGLALNREGRNRIESGGTIERRRTEILRAYMEPKKPK